MINVIIDVVVVLPWVPATPSPRRAATIPASASARESTGIPARSAARDLDVRARHRGADHDRVRVRRHVLGDLRDEALHPEQAQAARSAGARGGPSRSPGDPSRRGSPRTALMPAPPTPTTWMRRGSVRSSTGPGSGAGTGRLLHQVREPVRGIGTGQRPGGRRHRREPVRDRASSSPATASRRAPSHCASGSSTAAPAASMTRALSRLVVVGRARPRARAPTGPRPPRAPPP